MKYAIRFMAGNRVLFWNKDRGWTIPPIFSRKAYFKPHEAMSMAELLFKSLNTVEQRGSFEISLLAVEELKGGIVIH